MKNHHLVLLSLLTTLIACEVNDPPQKVKVSLSTSTADADTGDEITLEWSSDIAKSCTLLSTAGTLKENLPTSGQEKVKVTADETYTLACQPKIGGDKAGSAAIAVKVHPAPVAVIEANTAQIYLGDSFELTWKCENADVAALAINDDPQVLPLAGSTAYKPDDTATFKLNCSNKRGKVASAKTTVNVIAETMQKLAFASFSDLESTIDISQMKTGCGAGCIYKPFDRDRFNEDGTATNAFRVELEQKLAKPKAKVARAGTKRVGFDSTTTFAYGHSLGLDTQELGARCEQAFPYGSKNAAIDAEFSEAMESGSENLGKQAIPVSMVDGIEVSAKASRGVVKAGTEAALSYTLLNPEAELVSKYTDYENATGGYTLDSSGKVRGFAMSEGFEMLRSFPEGYPVPPAANGYAYDPNHGTCKTSVPQITNKRVFNSNAEYCGPGSPFQGDLACEPGTGVRPPRMPYTYYYYTDGQPFSAYVQPVGSLRVVEGDGQAQCAQWLPGLAATLGLGANWTAGAKLQYFTTDSRWPACGANCAGKEPRSDENDWRFGDIEPGKNFCIDRWAGLDWNQYRARIETACLNTQLYKDADAKAKQSDADQAFSVACKNNDLCRNSLENMKRLSDRFSIQALKSFVEKEESAMNKAKSDGKPYLIPEAKLAPSFIAGSISELAKIEAGLPVAKQIHESTKSTWTGGNRLVHSAPSIPGFDTPNDASESVVAYKQLLERAKNLVKTDIRSLGCKFEMTQSRFRKYDASRIGELAFPAVKQENIKTRVLIDTPVN